MRSYYQTTPLTAIMAAQYDQDARSQEKAIYDFMKKMGNIEFTAWMIQKHFPHYQITSIRRALHNLEHKAKLIVQTCFVNEGINNRPVGRFKAL
jgi:hypothetical protein